MLYVASKAMTVHQLPSPQNKFPPFFHRLFMNKKVLELSHYQYTSWTCGETHNGGGAEVLILLPAGRLSSVIECVARALWWLSYAMAYQRVNCLRPSSDSDSPLVRPQDDRARVYWYRLLIPHAAYRAFHDWWRWRVPTTPVQSIFNNQVLLDW